MWKFGLIGLKLGHSFSKGYHNNRFEENAVRARYDNYELGHAAEVVELFESDSQLRGVNVTIPFKEEVLPYLDRLDPIAMAVGGVNTIARHKGKLIGYNTDVFGFTQSLQGFIDSYVKRALVLGTGGGARAVKYALTEMNIAVRQVSRRPLPDVITYDEVTCEVLADVQLIVNCTPLGMSPETDGCPEIPFDCLSQAHSAFDLVYNPEKTLFLARSEKQGARIKNGLEMLHLQADRSWQIWQSYLDIGNEGSK